MKTVEILDKIPDPSRIRVVCNYTIEEPLDPTPGFIQNRPYSPPIKMVHVQILGPEGELNDDTIILDAEVI